MCVKNRGKPDEEPTFTWARGVVFEPPEWMRLEKGMEITALNGQTTLRSYKDNAGADKVSLDAKFSSFDIQVHGAKVEQQAAPAPRRPAAPSGGGGDEDSSPPFMRRSEWE
jgi:hypothetical protein